MPIASETLQWLVPSIVAVALAIRANQKARLQESVRVVIAEYDFVTKKDLDTALTAFGDKFRLSLIEQMNGETGFVRKSMHDLMEKAVADQIKQLRKEHSEILERMRKRETET
jgi:polyhydroxyalkanoate synthesis regulator protein